MALAALRGLHETLDFAVTLPGAAFFNVVLDFADEKGVQADVFFLPEQEAIGGEPVTPGAARFLVVLLDALRERQMNYHSHGRFIDAQPEGHGAHHDAHFVGHPLFLVFASCAALHLSVISNGSDAVFLEEIYGVANARNRGSVNN